MPATWRVRSRSTAAAGAVHVRARAMACRSGADSDTGGGHGAAIGHQDAPARAKGGRSVPLPDRNGRVEDAAYPKGTAPALDSTA